MLSKTDILKIQDLPIEQVAEALGLTVRRHTAICPFHDDSHPSLTFNTRRNRYRCFVCDAKGGVIDLAMNCLGLNFREACHWLARSSGLMIYDDNPSPFPDIHPRAIRPISNISAIRVIRVQEETPDVVYLERLMSQPIINEQASSFLYQERKISVNVVRELGLSSIAYDCPMSSSPRPTYFDGPALLIPYRDLDGKLLSVQSRYLGNSSNSCSKAIPRFRFPKGSSCHIFNLNCLKDLPYEAPVFITEGVTDCLAMLSAGYASIAIPSATLLRKEDVAYLKDRRLHMYPDADEPGERLFRQLKALLPQLVRHQLPAGFKDVGQYYSFIHKN